MLKSKGNRRPVDRGSLAVAVEGLESRLLMSGTVLPAAGTPLPRESAAVLKRTAIKPVVITGGTTDISATDPDIRAMVTGNEGFIPYVYPDSKGIPTVGIGVNIGGGNASDARKWLAAAGLNYDDVWKTWQQSITEWKATGHQVADLKTSDSDKAAWVAFVKAHPPTNVLDRTQAETVLTSCINTYITELNNIMKALFKGKFNFGDLDRRTQAALLDIDFNLGSTSLLNRGKAFLTALRNNDIAGAKAHIKDLNMSDPSRAARDMGLLTAAPKAAVSLTWHIGVSAAAAGHSWTFTGTAVIPQSGGTAHFASGVAQFTVTVANGTMTVSGVGFSAASQGGSATGSGSGSGPIGTNTKGYSAGGGMSGSVHVVSPAGSSDFGLTGSFTASAGKPA